MKELLVNQLSKARYTIYVNGVATNSDTDVNAKIIKHGDLAQSVDVSSAGIGEYEFVVPPDMTSEEGILSVEWNFTVSGHDMTVVEQYDVVTPYTNWKYFKDTASSYEEWIESERLSRLVIDSYCGQTFGRIYTTYAVEGNQTNGIRLPKRLILLDTIKWLDHYTNPNVITTPEYINQGWELTANNWVLRSSRSRKPQDPAYKSSYSFKINTTYNITGVWGWESVPTSVEEAAKILTSNFLCADQKYRDKYLELVKTGDWNLKFSDKAFMGTGSATADELLSEYRMTPGIGVI